MTQISCTGHIVEMNTEFMILYFPSLGKLLLLDAVTDVLKERTVIAFFVFSANPLSRFINNVKDGLA